MFFNKKIGFTLAEILIALGIVGIVSVIVTPGIVETGRKAKYGATLGKVVYQIELGAQNYIQDYNDKQTNGSYAQDLTGLGSVYSDDKLAEFAGADKVEEVANYRPSQYNGALANNLVSLTLYKFPKLEAEFLIHKRVHEASFGSDNFRNVIIDVNGTENPPNAYGKDLFRFKIDPTGKLIPSDTRADLCSGNITTGVECTARVVRDGFKINY